MRTLLTLPAWDAAPSDAPRALVHPSRDIRTSLARASVMDPAFDSEIDSVSPGSTLIAWSGRIDGSDPDPFAADPGSFVPGSMPAFFARIESLEPSLRARRIRLLIRPHARHIISDVPRAIALLAHQARSSEPHIGLALDPIALLEPSMVPMALDHIRRALETLARRANLIILTNARDAIAPSTWLTPARIEAGLIRTAELVSLAERLIPETCPIAILPGDTALSRYTSD